MYNIEYLVYFIINILNTLDMGKNTVLILINQFYSDSVSQCKRVVTNFFVGWMNGSWKECNQVLFFSPLRIPEQELSL